MGTKHNKVSTRNSENVIDLNVLRAWNENAPDTNIVCYYYDCACGNKTDVKFKFKLFVLYYCSVSVSEIIIKGHKNVTR